MLLRQQINNLYLVNIFFATCVCQLLTLSLIYGNGLMGNPNSEFKTFLAQTNVDEIIHSKTIYLHQVQGKTRSLMQYYLPRFKHSNESILLLPDETFLVLDTSLMQQNYLDGRNVKPISSYKNWSLIQLD